MLNIGESHNLFFCILRIRPGHRNMDFGRTTSRALICGENFATFPIYRLQLQYQ